VFGSKKVIAGAQTPGAGTLDILLVWSLNNFVAGRNDRRLLRQLDSINTYYPARPCPIPQSGSRRTNRYQPGRPGLRVEVFGNRRLSSALSMMLKTAVNKTATHNDVLEVKQVQCPKASLECCLIVEDNWFAKM
jgi:hypothetical protein